MDCLSLGVGDELRTGAEVDANASPGELGKGAAPLGDAGGGVQGYRLQACLSRRTLIRRFHDETGLPPMHWLLGARIDRARELLEASDVPAEVVARLSGLGTPANLRTLFKRHTGVPPSTYRSTFRRPAHADGAEDPATHY